MKLDIDQKEICDIDINIINDILNNIDENDWYVDDYRQSVPSMCDTSSIPIFHSSECHLNPNKALWSVKKRPLFDKYYPLIKPILEKFKDYYDFNYHASFLSRIHPQGIIGYHIDQGEFLERCHRIHVPIQTNENVFYWINGREYNWITGKSYEFDNTLQHAVFNRSNEHRIHLIINLYKLEDSELEKVKDNLLD